MAERGLTVDHSTIARWVLRYAPILNEPIRCEMRQAEPIRADRFDETYIRVAGQWTYLYRAIDSAGNTMDFLLSPHRDAIAAKGFSPPCNRAPAGYSLALSMWKASAYPAAMVELKRPKIWPAAANVAGQCI